MEDNVIYFYDAENQYVKKEHIFLNNFDPSPFVADDNFQYATVEHYYQCHKFDNFDVHPEFKQVFEEIRSGTDPLVSKKTARKYEKEFEGKWQKQRWEEGYKDEIMKKALVYKFSQNPDLLKRLLLTDNAILIERSDKDPYWGGLLPDSKNKLGNFIAELRDNYVKEKQIFIEGSTLERI